MNDESVGVCTRGCVIICEGACVYIRVLCVDECVCESEWVCISVCMCVLFM